MDLYATFAKIAGGRLPDDRILDSFDLTLRSQLTRRHSGRREAPPLSLNVRRPLNHRVQDKRKENHDYDN